MNKKVLIVGVLLLLVLGGYFLLRGSRPAEVPQNPEGVVNEEVGGSNYRLYSPAEYERAREEKKVIMLYFTANWCPICREQEPVNLEALEALANDEEIIAFRIHILDNETTPEGERLADEFAVRYQHTTIILNPAGEIVSTTTGPLTKEELTQKLLMAKEKR